MVKPRYKILFFPNGNPKCVFSNKLLCFWPSEASKPLHGVAPTAWSNDPVSIANFIKDK